MTSLPFPADDCTPADSGILKSCLACGHTKPLSEYYFYSKTGKPFARCKPCHNTFTKSHKAKRYAANPEHYRKLTRDYVAANRDEVNRKQREYRQANPDVVREHQKRYRDKPETREKKAEYRRRNSDRRRAYNVEYRRKNKPKITAYNSAYRREFPEVYRKATRKWQRNNPLKTAAMWRTSRHKRRAILANIDGSFTDAEWQAIKERQDFTCLMCRFREPFIKLTVDHVIPISKGGTNYASNLQALCDWCNSVKKDREIDVRTYLKARPRPRRKPARHFA